MPESPLGELETRESRECRQSRRFGPVESRECRRWR